MSATARAIYAAAALGSLVAYSDGTPRPPDRFKRKLRDWEHRNGHGRLVERHAAWRPGGPDSFTLHHGNYGSHAVTVLVVNITFNTESALEFVVRQPPLPGTVQVVTERDGHVELVHEAGNRSAAEAWLARNPYGNPRIVEVGAPEAEEPSRAAA